jgi:hypothetical protein
MPERSSIIHRHECGNAIWKIMGELLARHREWEMWEEAFGKFLDRMLTC